MRICSFLFAFFLILMMLSCNSPTAQTYPPTANLSTTWTTINAYVQPILFRETNLPPFVCGFLCEGNSCTSYLFSIFIPKSTSYLDGQSETVWSANQDYPVSINATLNFTSAGELVLKDVNGSIVWRTNTAGKSVAGMNLTDAGNLVLFDDHNAVVWQSFDHPTDTLLLGQKLSQGQKLRSSVYYLQVTDEGLFGYVESNPPHAYYREFFNSNRNDTKKGDSYIKFLNGSFSFFRDSSELGSPDRVIIIPNASSSTQYLKLMPDGHLKAFVWQSNPSVMAEVHDFTEQILGNCDYPLFCGRNSICSVNQQCTCPSFEYFKPVNDEQLNQGCSEITPLTCNSTKHQDFITHQFVDYFILEHDMVGGVVGDMVGVNMEMCKQVCLNNCSCKVAFFQFNSDDNSTGRCFIASEILTMQRHFPDRFVSLAFIKVQNVTTPLLKVTPPPLPLQVPAVKRSKSRVSHKAARVVGSTVGSFVLLLVVVIGFIAYIVRKRNRDAEMEEEYLDQVPGMPTRFSYEELKTATENFSKKLGEGGFGSVFEGSLKDGSKIAVKCLEGLSHIKKSFLAEVQSIGSIHHVNLVRLKGFCTWKSQRFLVYDFMRNGSLDRWIYHGVREHILEWECRKKIILDIAKGLAYLHEECRQKIVHLDIKPPNILLDNDFNAKVSDFGLSKLIDKNQTQVMSTIKGTPGYIAPEWRSSIITEKVDVYSFGIVLLEILCGRRIFDRSEPEESWFLLSVFQKCWEQGTLLDMVDKHSEDMQVHKTEVVEMMKVASWCLQTNFKRRPSMPSVVKVLEGGMNVESNLDYNFTDLRIQDTEVVEEKALTQLSSSLLSGPR